MLDNKELSNMSNKHDGFSLIEVLLVSVVVGILGFTGWFVWNGKKEASKTFNDSNRNSVVVAQAKQATTTSSGSTSKNYLTIKEWNVKFEIPSSLKSMNYSIDNNAVWFNSSDLTALAGGNGWCSLGSLARLDTGTVVETGAVKIKQIGKYIYWYGGSQQACIPVGVSSEAAMNKTFASSTLQTKVVDSMPALLKATLSAE